MRKLGTALLALPVFLIVYLGVAARSARHFRAAGFVGVAGLVALVLVAGARPQPSTAAPQSVPHTVAAQLLDAVATGHGLKAPFTIEFDAPMDAASVAAAMRLSPEAAVTMSWDAEVRTLTLAPVKTWAPDTLYTITVDTTAKAADGSVLGSAVRAVVMTVKGGTATLAATKQVGTRVAAGTAIAIHLDRAVPLSTVEAALQSDPSVDGTVTAASGSGDFVFTPAEPLTAGTTYTFALADLVDADGTPFSTLPSITVQTSKAPGIVRFRPVNGATGIERTAVLSVRFTEKMSRATTAKALSVTADGKPVAGKVAWAVGNTVLVFTPRSALPYGAKVVMTIGTDGTSAIGAALAEPAVGTFTVKAKTVAKTAAVTKTPRPVTKPVIKPIPKPTGGGGAVAGTWSAVEAYYLRLMNCTRTGGWVTSKGACSSPGGRDVAALVVNSGITAKVSRPYAKFLATHNICSHFSDGNPGTRLRRAGYTSYKWGENLGCRSGNPYSAVLGSHLFFQSERSYNGGHYVNLMNKLYSQVGIGVWVSGGRVRLVVDFYHP